MITSGLLPGMLCKQIELLRILSQRWYNSALPMKACGYVALPLASWFKTTSIHPFETSFHMLLVGFRAVNHEVYVLEKYRGVSSIPGMVIMTSYWVWSSIIMRPVNDGIVTPGKVIISRCGEILDHSLGCWTHHQTI